MPGFTKQYKIFRLVHFEMFGDIWMAIAREKDIKGWRREKKGVVDRAEESGVGRFGGEIVAGDAQSESRSLTPSAKGTDGFGMTT